MKLVFAAGDVGGARAILPLARAAWKADHEIYALANGIFQTEGQTEWAWHEKACFVDRAFWVTQSPDYYIYATSVSDPHALDISRIATLQNVPTLHVLDNWSNYTDRFIRDGKRAPYPDYYAVMDKLAFDKAKADGIPEASLIVSGHPNLAHLDDSLCPEKFKNNPQKILFVSEPAKTDNGAHKYRGYDEEEVTALVCDVLSRISPANAVDLNITIAAHPREDTEAVSHRWQTCLADTPSLFPRIVQGNATREALLNADYVIGMSSILLYEAWVLGKEVISLQPNLANKSLLTFTDREGLQAFTSSTAAKKCLEDIFIRGNVTLYNHRRQNDIDHHKEAAQTLLTLIESSNPATTD